MNLQQSETPQRSRVDLEPEGHGFRLSKRKLIEDGHIEQFATECRIADPFFAEFLRLA